MKNTYLTGYFPLIAILLFSSSLSISTSLYALKMLSSFGMYDGMLDYFSEKGIRLALFAAFALLYFMVLSALKLIANTVTELSLLFFANDPEGNNLKKTQNGFHDLFGRRDFILCALAKCHLDCDLVCGRHARLLCVYRVPDLFDAFSHVISRVHSIGTAVLVYLCYRYSVHIYQAL